MPEWLLICLGVVGGLAVVGGALSWAVLAGSKPIRWMPSAKDQQDFQRWDGGGHFGGGSG